MEVLTSWLMSETSVTMIIKNMDSVLTRFKDWFWNSDFWLPHGFTWEDIKSKDGYNRPQLSDLYIIPFLTIALLIVRYIFENYIAFHFCKMIGIRSRNDDIVKNDICNQIFAGGTKNPNMGRLKEIAEQTGWSTHQVSSWFRKKRKTSLMGKATESCWRCLVYTVFFAYGCYVLFKTDWFWDTKKWLVGYISHQSITQEMKWYYYMELSFYVSLLISQFTDTKRKDFFQLFVHHILTIILIIGSYIIAHFRFGAIIMLLHDSSDYWLEGAKIANYAKTQKLCDILFVVFAVTFFLSRWVYFPFWVMWTFINDNSSVSGPLQSYITFPYIFLYMCIGLLFLHFYWGFLIANMVYKFTVAGKVEKDARSDEDSD